MPEPQLAFEDGGLRVTFPFAETYLRVIGSRSVITPPVTDPVTPQVTPQVDSLLIGLTSEASRQQLMDVLGLRDRKHFADAYLAPALAAGFIEMTIPDKPNSRLQKYRLTAAGRARAAMLGRRQDDRTER